MVRDLKYQIVQNKPEIIWINSKLLEDRIDYDFYSINQIRVVEKLTKVSYRKLDDLVKAKRSEPQTDSKDFSYDGIDVIRMSDIDDFIIDFSNTVKIPIDIYENLKEFTLKPNTVIFGLTGVTLGKAVPISKNIKKCITNRRIAQLEIKDAFDSFYIATFINTQYGRSQLFRYSTGVAQPNIRLEDTGEILVPIPDYDIQKYIGDKVRKAEELREEAKRLKKEAETFLYEMIQLKPLNDFDKDMFSFVNSNYIDSERLDSEYYKTKYITLEKLLKSKKVTSFKDIIIESKYGASVPADYTMVGIPFIRGNNLTDNEINIDDIVYLNKKLKDEVKDHHVNTGDILITRSGTVGISAVVDEKCDGFSFGSFMIKLRIDMRIWNPYYIAAFLNSFWGKWQIERLQNGAVQQNINLQEIGRIIIPIISKENQDKIEELIKNYVNKKRLSKQLIQEAKQDVEDLIEGNLDMSKVKANS